MSRIATPPSYRLRRAQIVDMAAGVDAAPLPVSYLPDEDATWQAVSTELHPLWDRFACPEILAARDRLGLPMQRVPQLSEVNDALAASTGVRFCAVHGLLPAGDFFSTLARSRFPSTQYIRWSGAPDYTPEPDILHEVLGHGTQLAITQLAELHRLAGAAAGRLHTDRAVQRVADVFWYTVEFGVVRTPRGWRAYGAGLLSSPGELAWFADNANIRPLDIETMTTAPYDIDRYQPALFGARSLDHLLDVVGGFFESVRD